MKLGFVSDSLGGMSFPDLLDEAVRLGVSGVEVNTGGWSTAPHFDLATMKSDAGQRKAFLGAFAARDLEVISLNANGNPLHPTQPEQGEARGTAPPAGCRHGSAGQGGEDIGDESSLADPQQRRCHVERSNHAQIARNRPAHARQPFPRYAGRLVIGCCHRLPDCIKMYLVCILFAFIFAFVN